jgi:hypothetical protein
LDLPERFLKIATGAAGSVATGGKSVDVIVLGGCGNVESCRGDGFVAGGEG